MVSAVVIASAASVLCILTYRVQGQQKGRHGVDIYVTEDQIFDIIPALIEKGLKFKMLDTDIGGGTFNNIQDGRQGDRVVPLQTTNYRTYTPQRYPKIPLYDNPVPRLIYPAQTAFQVTKPSYDSKPVVSFASTNPQELNTVLGYFRNESPTSSSPTESDKERFTVPHIDPSKQPSKQKVAVVQQLNDKKTPPVGQKVTRNYQKETEVTIERHDRFTPNQQGQGSSVSPTKKVLISNVVIKPNQKPELTEQRYPTRQRVPNKLQKQPADGGLRPKVEPKVISGRTPTSSQDQLRTQKQQIPTIYSHGAPARQSQQISRNGGTARIPENPSHQYYNSKKHTPRVPLNLQNRRLQRQYGLRKQDDRIPSRLQNQYDSSRQDQRMPPRLQNQDQSIPAYMPKQYSTRTLNQRMPQNQYGSRKQDQSIPAYMPSQYNSRAQNQRMPPNQESQYSLRRQEQTIPTYMPSQYDSRKQNQRRPPSQYGLRTHDLTMPAYTPSQYDSRKQNQKMLPSLQSEYSSRQNQIPPPNLRSQYDSRRQDQRMPPNLQNKYGLRSQSSRQLPTLQNQYGSREQNPRVPLSLQQRQRSTGRANYKIPQRIQNQHASIRQIQRVPTNLQNQYSSRRQGQLRSPKNQYASGRQSQQVLPHLPSQYGSVRQNQRAPPYLQKQKKHPDAQSQFTYKVPNRRIPPGLQSQYAAAQEHRMPQNLQHENPSTRPNQLGPSHLRKQFQTPKKHQGMSLNLYASRNLEQNPAIQKNYLKPSINQENLFKWPDQQIPSASKFPNPIMQFPGINETLFPTIPLPLDKLLDFVKKLKPEKNAYYTLQKHTLDANNPILPYIPNSLAHILPFLNLPMSTHNLPFFSSLPHFSHLPYIPNPLSIQSTLPNYSPLYQSLQQLQGLPFYQSPRYSPNYPQFYQPLPYLPNSNQPLEYSQALPIDTTHSPATYINHDIRGHSSHVYPY